MCKLRSKVGRAARDADGRRGEGPGCIDMWI